MPAAVRRYIHLFRAPQMYTPLHAHRALQIAIRRPVGSIVQSAQIANRRQSSSHAPPNSESGISARGEASSIIYSDNQPIDLPGRVSQLTGWNVSPSKSGLIRQFTFPSFAAAWRFMSVVANECKAKRHHPSWHNLYNQVTIEWTTHKPKGLSIKDVEMAEFCDRTANEILKAQKLEPKATR